MFTAGILYQSGLLAFEMRCKDLNLSEEETNKIRYQVQHPTDNDQENNQLIERLFGKGKEGDALAREYLERAFKQLEEVNA